MPANWMLLAGSLSHGRRKRRMSLPHGQEHTADYLRPVRGDEIVCRVPLIRRKGK
jgi:hypothetical protein